MKFADDTKLGKAIYALEDRAQGLQTDLHRLEDWVGRGLMKMDQEKCQALHLGQAEPLGRCRLGTAWLGAARLKGPGRSGRK